ncbi:hypothetical protein [Nocardiopsis lucentensis]|uniref:hypothetical protein n=1 Tax=Nocardiopsis lucentensis TaxID=53441 RepID=UPI00034DEDA5|nr:hypothetical protein [Nocardiopsis lucentensis]
MTKPLHHQRLAAAIRALEAKRLDQHMAATARLWDGQPDHSRDLVHSYRGSSSTYTHAMRRLNAATLRKAA